MRTKQYRIQLSHDEWERIKKQANETGFESVAAYFRWLAHGHGVKLHNQKNRKT